MTARPTPQTLTLTIATPVTLSPYPTLFRSLTTSYTSAFFLNKNVGTGKTVNVVGISISGVDSGNYSANTTTNTTANITSAVLAVTAAGVNRVYDGTTNATDPHSDNRNSSHTLSLPDALPISHDQLHLCLLP